MTPLRRFASEDELAAALRAVGGSIDSPETPPIAPTVLSSIHEIELAGMRARPRLWLPSRRRTLTIALATVLFLASAAVAAELIIRIGAVTVRVTPAPTATPTRPESASAFGQPVSIAEAERRAGFDARIPRALGPPAGVWIGPTQVGSQPGETATRIVLAWRAGQGLPPIEDLPWGVVLMQFESDYEVAAKTLYSETSNIDPVKVGGLDGYWITGPHTLELLDPDGTQVVTVTGNVLLWQEGSITYRLETSLPLDQTLALVTT